MLARLLCVAACVAIAGCSAKPGDACAIDHNVCLDGKTMLACNSGVFVKAPCPGGCVDPGTSPAVCDFAGAKDGDVCAGTSTDQSVCVEERGARLLCRDHHLFHEACKGPNRCADVGERQTQCDRDLATVGDYCAPDAEASPGDQLGYACEFQGTNQLLCHGGKWSVAHTCSRCEISKHMAICTP